MPNTTPPISASDNARSTTSPRPRPAPSGLRRIGGVALQDVQYDPARWWAASEGVRSVLSEGIAYLYARLLFHPSASDFSP